MSKNKLTLCHLFCSVVYLHYQMNPEEFRFLSKARVCLIWSPVALTHLLLANETKQCECEFKTSPSM